MKLKKGDEVIVTQGKDKGKKGKIEKVLTKTGKVLVAGVNIYKKHQKSQGQRKPGGIIDIVKPLPWSNVSIVCPNCKKQSRVGFKITNGKKIRICRKCKKEIA